MSFHSCPKLTFTKIYSWISLKILSVISGTVKFLLDKRKKRWLCIPLHNRPFCIQPKEILLILWKRDKNGGGIGFVILFFRNCEYKLWNVKLKHPPVAEFSLFLFKYVWMREIFSDLWEFCDREWFTTTPTPRKSNLESWLSWGV